MTAGPTASVSCSADTAICTQAAAARQVRMSLQSKAGLTFPPTPPHAPRPPPSAGMRDIDWQGRCCLLNELASCPSLPTQCLQFVCLAHCLCCVPHFFCDYISIHTFSQQCLHIHTCFCLFLHATLAPTCPRISTSVPTNSSYLPLPTHTCCPHSFLHAHASSQQDVPDHACLCLHT